MSAVQMLGNATAGEFFLVAGGVVFVVGFVLVHFWREIIVGILAIWLVMHFLSSQEKDKQTPVVIEQETKVQGLDALHDQGEDEDTYLAECISLTQKREMCQEVWAQVSDKLK